MIVRGQACRGLRAAGSACRRALSTPSFAPAGSLAWPKKPRVLILGSGWGGNKVARNLDGNKFDVRLVSPSNHFLFTSFLPATAVGTLEFRAVQEPVRTNPNLSQYYQAKATRLYPKEKKVVCTDIFKEKEFELEYDFLIIAAGCKTNTFRTPGVDEREGIEVFFLKHLYHARQIRSRMLECFERAAMPARVKPGEVPTAESAAKRQEEIDRLLSFVVVGGGPTNCEFATELKDFLTKDVARWYPDLVDRVKVTIVEAGPKILGMFSEHLIEYYLAGLQRKEVDVRVNTLLAKVEIRTDVDTTCGGDFTVAHLKNPDGSMEVLPFGMMVWSAGLAPVKFLTENNNFEKGMMGRIKVDDYLRVPDTGGRVYAIGDCAVTPEPLPPIASSAEQQGQYLADCFNTYYYKPEFQSSSDEDLPLPGPVPAPVGLPFPRFMYPNSAKFSYINVGGMVSMGFGDGIVDMSRADVPGFEFGDRVYKPSMRGYFAMAAWRGGYLLKQLSYRNMMLIPMYWFKSIIFGRDISNGY